MSREIKFRAWDRERKEMLLPERICHLDGETTKELSKSAPYLILMQFTGLLDKNGKEIWEGDIVKNEWRHEPYSVSFFSGAFRGHWDHLEPQTEKSTGWVFDKLEADDCEIIGNIYENFELLEGK